MFVEPGSAGKASVAESSTALKGSGPSKAMVLIGPEGGWDPQEVSDAAAAGVTLVTLGSARLARGRRGCGGDCGAALHLAGSLVDL